MYIYIYILYIHICFVFTIVILTIDNWQLMIYKKVDWITVGLCKLSTFFLSNR